MRRKATVVVLVCLLFVAPLKPVIFPSSGIARRVMRIVAAAGLAVLASERLLGAANKLDCLVRWTPAHCSSWSPAMKGVGNFSLALFLGASSYYISRMKLGGFRDPLN